MPTADARLHAILVTYRRRYPEASEVDLLRKIDAKIVQVLLETMDILPITQETIRGFADMVMAIDRKLVELGCAQFYENAKVDQALTWLFSTSALDKVPGFLGTSYRTLREELWSQAAVAHTS